jgi:hypothetical protein
MSPWHVIGIDPAPSKRAVVYHDGAWGEGVKELNFNISPSFCFKKLAGVKWPIFQFFHSFGAIPHIEAAKPPAS